MEVKSVLGFDLDGTLTPRNRFEILPKGLSETMNELSQRGHVCIPVSGKPVDYTKNVFTINSLFDYGIIGENAGTFRRPGAIEIEIFGPGNEKMKLLRNTVIPSGKTDVTEITLNNVSYEVVVDPEDVSILTIFTDPKPVSQRWTFSQSIEAVDLVRLLKELITRQRWESELRVLDPFPDGGVQVIRRDAINNRDIDKQCWTEAVGQMFEVSKLKSMLMFGDGHNDIPAMKADGVIGITFAKIGR